MPNLLVLVVDDEEVVRRVITTALRRRGFRVVEAANGRQALQLISGVVGRIELIMVDVILPDISGPDLVKQLRQRYPDLRVLYISGSIGDVLEQSGYDVAGAPLLSKPFSLQEFDAKTAELLAGRGDDV